VTGSTKTSIEAVRAASGSALGLVVVALAANLLVNHAIPGAHVAAGWGSSRACW
jgi:hypothetical protein